jgi:hypothetical protein
MRNGLLPFRPENEQQSMEWRDKNANQEHFSQKLYFLPAATFCRRRPTFSGHDLIELWSIFFPRKRRRKRHYFHRYVIAVQQKLK